MFIWTTRTILVFTKKSSWYDKTLPKKTCRKNDFLRLSWKWINSSGVSSEKLPYVYEAPAGAFISEKLTFLKFWDMLILKKLHFCSYLVIREALRSLSKAICWGNTRRQLPGSPRGTKCARSWELGNTVRTPQCNHCLGNEFWIDLQGALN